MEQEKITHESFGQISIHRVTGGGSKFYGSELPQDNYISIEINHSELNRDLTKEWYFPIKQILRLRMTSNQFAELITSLNNGGGVPCTLERIENKSIEQFEKQESRKEFVHRKFKERMKEFAIRIRDNQQKAKTIVNKKTLSKQDINDLNFNLDWLTQEITSNIPFFMECFQETMDEVVLEAKTEVENAIQHKINVLGLNALQEQNKLFLNEQN